MCWRSARTLDRPCFRGRRQGRPGTGSTRRRSPGNRGFLENPIAPGESRHRRAGYRQDDCRRLERVLEKTRGAVAGTDKFQLLRAVELLEQIASADAQQILRDLAKGTADAWLTLEARTALGRLEASSAPHP